jgi:hypothetical protein
LLVVGIDWRIVINKTVTNTFGACYQSDYAAKACVLAGIGVLPRFAITITSLFYRAGSRADG